MIRWTSISTRSVRRRRPDRSSPVLLLGEALQDRCLPHELRYRHRRDCRIRSRRRDIAHHAGFRRDSRTAADLSDGRRSPTCPPTMTKSPSLVLPEIPTWPARMQPRPSTTLCPICTRLSIIVPGADHGIVPGAAVDRGIGADIDIVADDDPAKLRDFDVALAGRAQSRTRPDRSARRGAARRGRRSGSG